MQMCNGQISADLYQPTSYDGSGSPGKTATSRMAEAIREARTLLDGTRIVSHNVLTSWRSALTETIPGFGSYLQFITINVCMKSSTHISYSFRKLVSKLVYLVQWLRGSSVQRVFRKFIFIFV